MYLPLEKAKHVKQNLEPVWLQFLKIGFFFFTKNKETAHVVLFFFSPEKHGEQGKHNQIFFLRL